MKTPIEQVKELRNRTSAGIGECKDALSRADGDIDKALELLKERGLAIAAKKKERLAADGLVEAYIHHTKRIGVLVELNCETDFVARTEEFKALARDLAMQVAATAPLFLTRDDIPPEETELDPKVVCLAEQPFIKEPDKTVDDVIKETISKVGENIGVRRYARFELGASG